jgi:hypothetical protein
MKICTRCKVEKPLDLFGNNKSQKDGKNYLCLECARTQNKEATRKYRATTVGQEKSRKAAREAMRNYRATSEGRKKNRKASLNHARNHPNGFYAKLKNDPLFKLTYNLRSLISNSIKKQGLSKTNRTATILGCDFEFFQLYMEMQFKPGMSWDNHGEWHIDHKTPISWAKTEEEVIKLNHYTNLQPLWAVENIQKGNRYAN